MDLFEGPPSQSQRSPPFIPGPPRSRIGHLLPILRCAGYSDGSVSLTIVAGQPHLSIAPELQAWQTSRPRTLFDDPHTHSKCPTRVLSRGVAAVVLRQVVGSVAFLGRSDGLLGRREKLRSDISMVVGACKRVWELTDHASVERALWG